MKEAIDRLIKRQYDENINSLPLDINEEEKEPRVSEWDTHNA